MNSKHLCLGALMLGDSSGYQIRELCEKGPFSQFHRISYGSIYPALRELLKEGLVTYTKVKQIGRPDKNIYSITPIGIDSFQGALKKPPTGDFIRSDTLFMLFFAERLDDPHVEKIYDGYINSYRQQIELIKEAKPGGASEGAMFVRGFGIEIYETILRYMEDNREEFLRSKLS